MTDEFELTPPDEPAAYAEPDTGEMPPEDVEAMNQTLPMLISFLVIPLLIVIVGTGVFLAFGMASYEEVEPRAFVEQLRSGSANRRWQAAFELAKHIAQNPEAMREQDLAPPLIQLFTKTGIETEEERVVRRYLALCLGSLGDPAAVPALREALQESDAETRIYVASALGQLGAPEAAPDLIALLEDPDAGVVKAAVYGLGALDTPAVRPALVLMLDHAVADVRWNAAVSLAKLGDLRCAPVLREMLDRTAVSAAPDIDQDQVEQVMTSAIRSGTALRLDGMHDTLVALAESDPNLRVRDAAFQALEALRPQPEALAGTLHVHG